ncbi:hypothetical protein ACFL3N_02495 [Candidatus Omnitrophota bacterium]
MGRMRAILLIIVIAQASVFMDSAFEQECPVAEFEDFIEEELWDGGYIRCYFSDPVLNKAGQDREYALLVKDAAVFAYTKLTREFGFPGVGRSQGIGKYRERDKTIEIFIGDSETPNFKTSYFVPRTYEELKVTWDAVILMPNEPDILRPRSKSALKRETLGSVVKGTVMHEITHALTFQCNKNIRGARFGENWYVEGLARFMETKAGSWSSFYAKGYERKAKEGYAFCLKEGANYFLKSTNRPLSELSYDYAIFWQYIDSRFGARKLADISIELGRLDEGSGTEGLKKVFRKALKKDPADVYSGFIAHIYEKSVSTGLRDEDLDEVTSQDFDMGSGNSRALSVHPLGINSHKLTNLTEGRVVMIKKTDASELLIQDMSEDENGGIVSKKMIVKGRKTFSLPGRAQKRRRIFIFNTDPSRQAKYSLYSARVLNSL